MAHWEGPLIIGLLSGLAALGVVASIARGRVPLLFVALVVGGWAIVMIAAGAWYGACTRCTSHMSYDSARELDFFMSIFGGGFFVAGILAVAWLASLLSILLREVLTKRPARPGRSR